MKLIKKRYLLKQPPNIQQIPGPQGPPGPAASFEFPISTDNVDYRGDVLTDIIDELLYVPLTISSFGASPSIYEKGQVVTSLPLVWNYNKNVVSQSLSSSAFSSAPSLLAAERAKTVAINNAVTNFIVTLTGNDGVNSKNSSISVQFLNKIYWGASIVPGIINSAFILALQNEFKANREKSFGVNLGAGAFAWFAYPVSYGLASVKTNGFNGGFNDPIIVSFTNSFGYNENYYVYRSTNSNLGLTDVVFF